MSSDSLWSLFITAKIAKAAVGRKYTEAEPERASHILHPWALSDLT
jgi:hypothetical protein